ncbi:MAG: glycosyltransferase family 2 protein [Hyphomicrobiales bacterium]|nr:glycosyltransferase family 2 protein [Hyphomicrobiales bacterium]
MSIAAALLTVVVPVHDTEDYLEECIGSILEQPIDNLEIIAVDDASTDGSPDILSRLAAADERLRVLTMKTNVGPGLARNAGLAGARSTYVAFLDSDDFYLPGALARLLAIARSDRVDFAAGSAQSYLESSSGEIYTAKNLTRKNLVDARSASIEECPEIIYVQHSCQCVFNRDFLAKNDLQFRRSYHEDNDFITECIFAASVISVMSGLTLYNHRKRNLWRGTPPSITQQGQVGERLWLKLDNRRNSLNAFRRSPRPSGPKKRRSIEQFFVCRDLTHFARGVLPVVARDLTRADRSKYYGQLAELYRPSTRIVRCRPHRRKARRRYSVDADVALIFELLMDRRHAELDALLADEPINEETINALLHDGAPTLAADLFRDLKEGTSRLVRHLDTAQLPVIPEHVARVVLHIGMRKTGSTYLQNVLEQNRTTLAGRGVLFPAFGMRRRSHARPLRTAGHDALVDAISSGNLGRVAGFRDEIAAAAECDRVILSCERLSLLGTERDLATLQAMLGNTEQRIVLVLRRQDIWAEACYREMVTNGYGRTTAGIEEYAHDLAEQGVLDYRRLVEMWARAFGRKDLTIRTLDDIGVDPLGFVREVVGLAGAADNGDLVEPDISGANRFELGRDDLEVIRLFNGLPFYNRRHYFEFVDAYHGWRASEAEPANRFRLMAFETRRLLVDRYREGNAWIAREFFGRDSDLFEMEIVDDSIEAPDIPLEKLRFAFSFYANTGDRHAKAGTRNLVHGGWLDDIVRRAESKRRKRWPHSPGTAGSGDGPRSRMP